ncbi:rhodanese-like domain-containing protein [Homoserinibacter sp. GY 40078]|uniref:rhodanese-like domain-containing protein n=1 Tax=Homoserinibacter sp. GY 40078 TaxID=2603275 RepID=UPI0011CB4729|nr:rhodanese-like domain-containing protein [Homoserinibacter sp. GY 40078]TXK19657.1 rhodanese-like domain-containing protein [Homoserinibacter sp. GY 40078]
MQQIDPQALAALDDAVIVDVREEYEWNDAHVAGAHLVPLSLLANGGAELPAARPLYIMCHSGGRSARVTAALEEDGIEAIDVAGGITAWIAAGLPVERGAA